MFNAFIQVASKEIDIKTEVKHIDKTRNYRLDMLIEYEKEKVIIEFKEPFTNQNHSHQDQLLDYLIATNIKHGILWYPKNVPSSNFLEIEPMTNFARKIYYTSIIK